MTAENAWDIMLNKVRDSKPSTFMHLAENLFQYVSLKHQMIFIFFINLHRSLFGAVDRTFLPVSVVDLHMHHSTRLIAQHGWVASIPFGNGPQLSQILICPPQFATWKNRWIIYFPKSHKQQVWLPMEAHAIIICLSFLYHMYIIRRRCALICCQKRGALRRAGGRAREGEREKSKEIGLEHYACSLPSVSQWGRALGSLATCPGRRQGLFIQKAIRVHLLPQSRCS